MPEGSPLFFPLSPPFLSLPFRSNTLRLSRTTETHNISKQNAQDSPAKYRRGITPNGCRWAVNLSLGGIADWQYALQSRSSTSISQSTRRYFELFRRCSYVEIAPQYDHRGSTLTSARVEGVLWSAPLISHASVSLLLLGSPRYLYEIGVLCFFGCLNSPQVYRKYNPFS